MTKFRDKTELKLRAIAMIERGDMSGREIARELGVSHTAIRCWIDTAYRKRRNAEALLRDRESRARRSPHRRAKEPSKARQDEVLQIVPLDTRGLTGRLCGDPLPGRSALEKRQP